VNLQLSLINDSAGERIRCPYCNSALFLRCPSECTIDSEGYAIFSAGSQVFAVCVVCRYSEAFLAPNGRAVCVTQGKAGAVRCMAR